MHYRLLCLTVLSVTLLAGALVPASAGAQPASAAGRPDQVTLLPSQGLGLASAGADYLSAPTAAAHPFTHMLLRRTALVPAGAALTVSVRASADGVNWSGWAAMIENDDLWVDADGPQVEWSQTIDAGMVARFWQVRGQFAAAPDGALPELRQVEVNTVDASVAPTPIASSGVQTAGAIARPAVVSRVGWGSPDGQGSRVAPSYYPVNHIVVHHTADSSTLMAGEPNWAARVRAEWSFHTYSRGWGDVGYNYLIDPNGVIYEGRAGGDDAVAFHDTANYGSMGIVMIGTYDTSAPPAKAQDSLVALMAWKATQKHIDPLGSSYYYGCAVSKYCYPYRAGAVVPNIAGHRQVTPGHTSCPGDSLLAILPGLRNRVKQLISAGPSDNGDLVVDDLESGFARSNTSWHESSCGYGDHVFWTYASNSTAENGATWRPNIPSSGTYRVYAHVPQGCGIAPPPYASMQARYTISYANGSNSQVVDQNTSSEWVDLGAYQFNAGTGGAVELTDSTGEAFAASKVLFFDAVKWVPENAADTNVQLTNVAFDRTSLASGELLKVSFTVKNTGGTTIYSQQPRVDLTAGGGLGDSNNGYVYDQDECFNGNTAGSYPAYPKESDRFRVTLGVPGWDASHSATCAGTTGDNPWRWGLNSDLAPNTQQTIVGYVRFRTPASYSLQAGLIQEYVKYYTQSVNTPKVTVSAERIAPDAASFDSNLTPLAQVYRLGDVPDNFLARTSNPLSIPRGQYVGSMPWDGRTISWGAGGPLSVTDQFLIEQTRVFLAPSSGEYSFRTISDDGSWLWIDGQPVVVNNGLHDATDSDGQITLQAGPHVLAFKYFERTGDATAGYAMQAPGEDTFRTLTDGLGSGAAHLASIYTANPSLVLAADDQGGTGVSAIRWSWDGSNWQNADGALLSLGKLANGSYHLRYQAIDKAGNQGQQRDLSFVVNTNLTVYRVSLPAIGR